jgi:hypothetical protein
MWFYVSIVFMLVLAVSAGFILHLNNKLKNAKAKLRNSKSSPLGVDPKVVEALQPVERGYM